MAKEKKATEKKPRPDNYEQPLKVKGSFLQLMQAAVKDAKGKDKKKP